VIVARFVKVACRVPGSHHVLKSLLGKPVFAPANHVFKVLLMLLVSFKLKWRFDRFSNSLLFILFFELRRWGILYLLSLFWQKPPLFGVGALHN
jgi:hypothetical protein